MSSREIDSTLLRRTCGAFPTGVAVVTAMGDDGTPHGMTVNSFTSVSLRPPLVLFCVDHRSAAYTAFRQARAFGINLLSSEQRSISDQFSRRAAERFRNLAWTLAENGAPRLRGVIGFLEAELFELIEAGDHTVFIGRVTHASREEGDPLVFYSGNYAGLSQL